MRLWRLFPRHHMTLIPHLPACRHPRFSRGTSLASWFCTHRYHIWFFPLHLLGQWVQAPVCGDGWEQPAPLPWVDHHPSGVHLHALHQHPASQPPGRHVWVCLCHTFGDFLYGLCLCQAGRTSVGRGNIYLEQRVEATGSLVVFGVWGP